MPAFHAATRSYKVVPESHFKFLLPAFFRQQLTEVSRCYSVPFLLQNRLGVLTPYWNRSELQVTVSRSATLLSLSQECGFPEWRTVLDAFCFPAWFPVQKDFLSQDLLVT
ncbi:hypothetical protein AMECASPLE_029339 [Ameca splendens]|uniref:Uncharacterized protein n=1 Tax=Ameca splendens TaxID=208324 RepID=A0ABV0YHY0_9TELE